MVRKNTWRRIATRPHKPTRSLIPFILPLLSIFGSPVVALAAPVGVVRSPENSQQWSAIVSRLQASGVDFCIVESKDWLNAGDLRGVGVLILPNVGNITGSQVEGLREWIARGGKVIATGPTGSLSLPDIQDQLRSLLGAYWGFSNSSPSSLKVVASNELSGASIADLSSTLAGGVLIPAGLNSRPAAVWISEGKTPAVVLSSNATYLGWRWGVDNVAPVSLDSAWLKVALRRFGMSPAIPNGLVPLGNVTPPAACRPPANAAPFPILSPLQKQPRERLAPQSINPDAITPLGTDSMGTISIGTTPLETTPLTGSANSIGSTSAAPNLLPPSSAIFSLRPLSTLVAEKSDRSFLYPSTETISKALAGGNLAKKTAIQEASVLKIAPLTASTVSSTASSKAPSRRNLGSLPVAQNPSEMKLIADNREQSFLPPSVPTTPAITPAQVRSMNQELQNLIARFESTLLAAESKNSSTSANLSANATLTTKQSYRTINNARQHLQTFQQLVNQQQYDQARQLWLKARRELWDNYPTDRQFAQPEIRAMWLDRGTIVKAKSEEDLAKIFDRIAEAGINTVFFETINASYPLYPSKIAPEQNPLTVGWDPLKAAVKLAHERKMELHAWTWIFAAANQGHNKVMGQPIDYLGPVLSRHPDWGITDKEGNAFDRGPQFKKAFYDPANPEVQQYILNLLEEISSNYEVDGIHIDYIRYPFQDSKFNQTFGYSAVSRQLFKDMMGVDPISISASSPLWSQWTAFRMHQVDSFVATLSSSLKQKHPNLILSASVFPMGQRDRIFRLQQNWEEWVRQGWVDMVVIMTYALDSDRLDGRVQTLADPKRQESALIIPGLRLLKVPDSVTVDQLQLVRNLPTGGFSLFAAENLTPNLGTILNRTQSSASPEPIPYRYPFKAASARFQSLQREWQFLVGTNQLAMASDRFPNWSRQVDGLAKALNQLADQPSAQELQQAQALLTQFRQQFGGWMQQQQQIQPYQVATWDNRLSTLSKLLTYGDRFVLKEHRGK